MCPPSQARRLLARAFPAVDAAYRDSLPSPDHVSVDPVEDVDTIVERFSARMDAMGGEPAVKRWVPPHVVGGWRDVSIPALDVDDSPITPELLRVVVQRKDPFVVLVRGGVVQQVVDRAALATRMAVAAP